MEKESPQKECPKRERVPLGDRPYLIRLSREEVNIAYRHRSLTGEPIQSFVRRLLREYNLKLDEYRSKKSEGAEDSGKP